MEKILAKMEKVRVEKKVVKMEKIIVLIPGPLHGYWQTSQAGLKGEIRGPCFCLIPGHIHLLLGHIPL